MCYGTWTKNDGSVRIKRGKNRDLSGKGGKGKEQGCAVKCVLWESVYFWLIVSSSKQRIFRKHHAILTSCCLQARMPRQTRILTCFPPSLKYLCPVEKIPESFLRNTFNSKPENFEVANKLDI